MKVEDIMKLVEQDASKFHLAASDALAAFVEILSELAGQISADDLETLIAIGSVLRRVAGEQQPEPHGGAHPAFSSCNGPGGSGAAGKESQVCWLAPLSWARF